MKKIFEDDLIVIEVEEETHTAIIRHKIDRASLMIKPTQADPSRSLVITAEFGTMLAMPAFKHETVREVHVLEAHLIRH